MKIKKRKDAFNDSSIKIPFFIPNISREDRDAVYEALKAPLLTDGPKLSQFETAFARFTGSKFGVGVSNATAALHLSLKSFGIGRGDEVIVPDLTFVATANAVILSGATPVLSDININDMNISIKSIKNSVTKRTKAIIPVHFAGKSCDMSSIMKIARKNNLIVIEDCAHAIGTLFKQKHVGTWGHVGCFSFYPTKNITTLEGGMVITNSKKTAKKIQTARNHGITRSLVERYSKKKPWEYDIIESGYNYRLDEIRSTLGISQLCRIKKLNKLRKKAFEYYNHRLQKIKGIQVPELVKNAEHGYHLYIIRIQKKFGIARDTLFHKLLDKGIRTSVHYKPLHQFSIIKNKSKIYDKLSNTNIVYTEIISLPFYPDITRQEQDFVIKNIQHLQKY